MLLSIFSEPFYLCRKKKKVEFFFQDLKWQKRLQNECIHLNISIGVYKRELIAWVLTEVTISCKYLKGGFLSSLSVSGGFLMYLDNRVWVVFSISWFKSSFILYLKLSIKNYWTQIAKRYKRSSQFLKLFQKLPFTYPSTVSIFKNLFKFICIPTVTMTTMVTMETREDFQGKFTSWFLTISTVALYGSSL